VDAADVGDYFFNSINATDSASRIFTSMFDMSDAAPLTTQLQADIPSSVGVDVYETNVSALFGTALETMRDPYVAGQAAGSALADRLLTGMYLGIARQNVWNLAQYNYSGQTGNVALYGIVTDLTTSASFRPTGLAVEMLNSAVGGDFYPVTAAGAGASGINAAAFLNHGDLSMAITSASATPTTVSISPADPVGSWSVLQLKAPSATATNEVGTGVSIVPEPTVSNPVTLSISAYGFVVLLPAHGT
jgi:hypothetical protein